jgi:hypothetical protein
MIGWNELKEHVSNKWFENKEQRTESAAAGEFYLIGFKLQSRHQSAEKEKRKQLIAFNNHISIKTRE